MIDLLKFGILDRFHNAARVASSRSTCVAGIDEQRLSGRRNEERRIATIHIDDIYAQRAWGPRLCHDTRRRQRGNGKNPEKNCRSVHHQPP